MQSFLQYKRTGDYVKSRFSTPSKLPRGQNPISTPPQIEGGRIVSHESVNTLATSLNETQTNSTRSTTTNDIEAGLLEDGITLRKRTTIEGKGDDLEVMEVGWAGPNDPENPKNWNKAKRVTSTLLVAYVSFACLTASSIDSAVSPQAAKHFGVSPVVESLATAQFLLGSAFGSLFTGPISETFGRSPVYIGSMIFFMIFAMASALSPNIGAQITFRFFVGVFGCAPLTVAGGSNADLWNSLEKTYGFPLFAVPGFGGAMLGPVIGSYMGAAGGSSWRWTDWTILILAALITIIAVLFMPETHPQILLSWRAKHLRKHTGDKRYQSHSEIIQMTFFHRLYVALTRPVLLATEPIVMVITLYLTIVWAILFTFLDGYTFIFTKPYGISQGLTNVIFVAMYLGVCCGALLVPIVYSITKKDMEKQKGENPSANAVRPETRLWYAMLGGGWALPVSLLWLGWTNYPSISIWCPIFATALFGFGLINIFNSSYMYIIDSYQINAASALTFATVVRYVVSGGLVVAGVPFYEKVGSHWTCTILGVLALLMAPAPYVLYRWGPKIRKLSKYSVHE